MKKDVPPLRMIHADTSTTVLEIDCEHQFRERLPSNPRKAVCRTCHQRLKLHAGRWCKEPERAVVPSLYNPYVPARKDEDE